MKKIVILSLLLSGAATLASAQTKEKYYSEKATDNIFVSVGVGAQIVTNPSNFDYGFGKSLTPLVNVSVGKLFNPVWGIRGQVAGWSGELNTQYPFEEYYKAQGQESWNSYKETFFAVNADAMLNLTNLFCGYKEGRKFEFLFFAGPTLNISKTAGSYVTGTKVVTVTNPDGSLTYKQELDPSRSYADNDKTRFLVGASLGLGAKYNINEKWAIDLEARGTVTPSVFGAKSDADGEGIVGLNVGATYTFGGKKFVSCSSKVDEQALNNEINKYREELAQSQADLADAKNALANAQSATKEVVKEVQTAGPRAIFFKIGSARLDDYGKVNIQLAAKALKANPEKKYKVAGYCDKATGSASWNQKLSEKRAQVVYDALVAEGVDKDQLELVGFGGTDNMFGKNFLNRCVILE